MLMKKILGDLILYGVETNADLAPKLNVTITSVTPIKPKIYM